MADGDNIPAAVKKSFDTFCKIRGKSREEFTEPFWDLVVLTASDEEQRNAFDMQIKHKLARKEIPQGIPYHVFADPPGPKAGCGTSTMYVICRLREIYGDKLESFRILLLNCGGQSQRLPSCSILGKLFMALPLGSPPLSLFEYKLFYFMPLLDRMAPGYMHCPADTIEVYDLGEDSDWTFERPGFTALAHPSSAYIGTTHGVYVLAGENKMQNKTDMRECEFVLQKPSVEVMRDRSAFVTAMDGKSEFVYTDSNFFFDHGVANKLAEFYQKEAPLNCEIDGYTDFLQPLGNKATMDYIKDVRNISKLEPRLLEVREKIFHLLKGTPLHIVAMNASKFYHLGTMKEYIYHFCEDDVIVKEMGFSPLASCQRLPEETDSDTGPEAKKCKVDNDKDSVHGCLIQCRIHAESSISSTALLEFCDFPSPVHIGANCIISSCSYEADDSCKLSIPEGSFIHTVAIEGTSNNSTQSQYITVAFHVEENIKKVANSGSVEDLVYYNKPLSAFSKCTGLKTNQIFPAADCPTQNLWHAKLFAVASSMNESFRVTHKVIEALQTGNFMDLSGYKIVSMADIMKCKNPAAMLDYRQSLYDKMYSK